MECEIAVADHGDSARPELPGTRSHVIVLGPSAASRRGSHVAQCIADMGGNIETVTQLSTEPASALDMLVRTEDPALLRAVLVQAADDTGVDIAVEPAGLRRRAKRLVATRCRLDVDPRRGDRRPRRRRPASASRSPTITARAMAGELDFRRRRCASGSPCSPGLPKSASTRCALRCSSRPEARTFVRTLRRLGYYVGVVSGSFTAFTDRFVDELGLDFAAANELEIVDGVLTGRVLEPIMDRAGKADALRRFADKFGVPLSQTVAVGDGANDIDMLETAGLSIAFNAKPALRAAADTIGEPAVPGQRAVRARDHPRRDRRSGG